MKKLLLTLLMATTAQAENVELPLQWDAVTAQPPVTHYTIYKDDAISSMPETTTATVTVDNSKTTKLEVSASNQVGESGKSDPLFVARPATPANLKLAD